MADSIPWRCWNYGPCCVTSGAAHGMTILLSSHLLWDLGGQVDVLLILIEGRCLFQGTAAQLTGKSTRIRIDLEPRPDGVAAARAAARLGAADINASPVRHRRRGTLDHDPAVADLRPLD